MLKEIYVVSDGKNLYYYSPIGLKRDYMETNLTTGLLSAVQHFMQEARKSDVDYFSSVDEIFVYTSLNDGNMLIGVFDGHVDRSLARALLQQAKIIIMGSHILKEENLNKVNEMKNNEIDLCIDQILERVLHDSIPVETADKVYTSLSTLTFLRILNRKNNNIIYENARPKPILAKQKREDLKLVISTVDKLSERFGLGEFTFLLIELEGSFVGILRVNNLIALGFASGIVTTKEFSDHLFELFSMGTYSNFIIQFMELPSKKKLELDNANEIVEQIGFEKLPMVEIFTSSVLNSLESLIKPFIRKSYQKISIFYSSDAARLVIDKNNSNTRLVYYSN